MEFESRVTVEFHFSKTVYHSGIRRSRCLTLWRELIYMKISYPGARSQKFYGVQMIEWTLNWRSDLSFL